jgi:3-hydroxyacyl-[acyl-carrier-protein] dehydratase
LILKTLDAADIQGLIPHRHPFLFIRSAVMQEDGSISGEACWPADHPVFEGHFPGFPIVPGVLQIEAAAQLGGILLVASGSTASDKNAVGVLASVRRADFRKKVSPDDVLHIHAAMRSLGAQRFIVSAEGQMMGEKAFSTEVVIAVRPISEVSHSPARTANSAHTPGIEHATHA